MSDRFICFIFDSETISGVGGLCSLVLRATTEKKLVNFSRGGDLAGGFSDFEMTWLFYCTGAATG